MAKKGKQGSRGTKTSTPKKSGPDSKTRNIGATGPGPEVSAVLREMIRKSELGPRGLEKTFGNYRDLKGKGDALKAAKQFVANVWSKDRGVVWIKGLVLYGPTGTGKTHLAQAVVGALIRERGIFAVFLPTVRIPRQDQDKLLKLTDPDEVPVLVLDDLGAEKLTDRAMECLQLLVDGRLQAGAPLVVTMNYSPPELIKRLEEGGDGCGARIVGRLREGCDFVPVGGSDMRVEL